MYDRIFTIFDQVDQSCCTRKDRLRYEQPISINVGVSSIIIKNSKKINLLNAPTTSNLLTVTTHDVKDPSNLPEIMYTYTKIRNQNT